MNKNLNTNSLEQEVELAVLKAFSDLLENKHLYQSATVDFAKAWSLLPAIADKDYRDNYTSISHNRLPSQEQVEQLKKNIREKHIKRMANWAEGQWNLVDQKTAKTISKSLGCDAERVNSSRLLISSIKTFCTACNSGPWPHNPAKESGDRGYPSEVNENKTGFQVFTIPFQCQNCKGNPLIFFVKRDGLKLTLVGRSEFPEVSVPSYIPRDQQKFYRQAAISNQTSFVLAAALYLRTVLEQHFRAVIPENDLKAIQGIPTGDELADMYAKTLPNGFPSSFPSLKKAYSDLSVIVHSGQENDDVKKSFSDIRAAVDGHFKAVQLFKEMPIQ